MRGDVEEFVTTVDAIAYLPRDVLRADGLYTLRRKGSRVCRILKARGK
jgi:hypothetical protein